MSPRAGSETPSCSVVVGARLSEHDLGRCLRSLEDQVGDDVEVIVVDDGEGGSCPPWVRHRSRPRGLVPELWATGMADARGEVIALTTAGLVPGPTWVAQARAALEPDRAAVGGAIEPGPGLGLVDWAIYFCRYAPYMLPIVDASGLDVPGDNAVYRADVVRRYRSLWEGGFWEPFVHRAMVSDGHRLVVQPELVVRQAPGLRAGSVAAQRYRHGRAYGQLRSARRGPGAVLAACLTAPLVPPLMAARAGRQVWSKRRHLGRFSLALPLVLWFYTCWAAGEMVGRLRAVLRRGGRG
jgi:hypothetical protein